MSAPAAARMRRSSATLPSLRDANTTNRDPEACGCAGPEAVMRLPNHRGQRRPARPGYPLKFGEGRATLRSQLEQLVEQLLLKGAPSAVPCTSTNAPSPVMTTFMSVSAATSSS